MELVKSSGESGAVIDRLVSGAVKFIVTSGRSYRKEGTTWEAKLPD